MVASNRHKGCFICEEHRSEKEKLHERKRVFQSTHHGSFVVLLRDLDMSLGIDVSVTRFLHVPVLCVVQDVKSEMRRVHLVC